MNRREFLRTSAQAAAVLAAAACSSSSSGGSRLPTSSTSVGGATSTTGGNPPSLDTLAAHIHGRVVTPADPDFSVAHVLYDPIYDTITPTAVVQAADVHDIATVIGLRRDYGTGVAIRGGGHSYGGWSTGTELVLDVTRLRDIKIDTKAGTVQVGPGVRLYDFYDALDAQNVAVPAGTCPTVGITGLPSAAATDSWRAARAHVRLAARGRHRHCRWQRAPLHRQRELRPVLGAPRWRGRQLRRRHFPHLPRCATAPPDVTTFSVEWAWAEAANGLAEWMAWVPTLPAQTTTIARLETTPVLVVAGVHLGTRDETRQLLAPLYNGVPTIQRSATARSYADAMLLEASCLHNTSAQCAPAPPTGASPILGPRQPFVATSHYFEHPLPASAINAAIDAMNNHLTIARQRNRHDPVRLLRRRDRRDRTHGDRVRAPQHVLLGAVRVVVDHTGIHRPTPPGCAPPGQR